LSSSYVVFIKYALGFFDYVRFLTHGLFRLCENGSRNTAYENIMKLPPELRYSPLHLWARHIENDLWEAGITDYAQDLLGDIVFLQPPQVGSKLVKDAACGLVESVKTGSDLHAPLSGIVTEINEDLVSAPEALNDKPYKAWIFRLRATQPDETNDLLSAEGYAELIET